MKIDKKNIRHWLYLISSGVFALVGVCLRPFRFRKSKLVVLYGHKLNGNLKAFADYVVQSNIDAYQLAYATLDPHYYKEIKATAKIPILSMRSLKDMVRIAKADVIITSHGLHTLAVYKKLTNIKFVNVWHGIGWKGHTPEEFSFANSYTDNWVSSEMFQKIYRNVFGVQSPIHVTGYARSDNAVNGNYSAADLRKKYQISEKFQKIILFAPTWAQGHGNYSIFPFNETAESFLKALNAAAKKIDSLIIFRTHLNTRNVHLPPGLSNVALMPYSEFPEAEEFLYMADILVSDWSSIVFDYLPLSRPTIFLGVPSPYERLCMSESYRFGAIVSNLGELTSAILKYVKNPDSYQKECKNKIKKAVEGGYGKTLDGKSAERYHRRLVHLLEN